MEDFTPALLVLYATAIGLFLVGLNFVFDLLGIGRPPRSNVERGASILKALALAALVLGIACSIVILLFLATFLFLARGPL